MRGKFREGSFGFGFCLIWILGRREGFFPSKKREREKGEGNEGNERGICVEWRGEGTEKGA